MNPIIELLASKGRVDVAGVKRIYRQMCRATHPDALTVHHGGGVEGECGKAGSGDRFLALRESYEEALDIARRAKASATEEPTGFSSPLGALTSFLYRLKSRSDPDAAEEALRYLARVAPDLALACEDIRRVKRSRWPPNDILTILDNGARQLEFYLACRIPHYRAIFESYLRELRSASRSTDADSSKAVTRIAAWLEEELDRLAPGSEGARDQPSPRSER
jgi:hypothetical protein